MLNFHNTKGKTYSYERDIVHLPSDFENESGTVKIPHSSAERDYLASNGLIGKISLSSDMTEREINREIRSVFRVLMGYDTLFDFKILQTTGGKSKHFDDPSGIT